MASNSNGDDEYQRGNVDDNSTVPRYTIAQLFELLLTLAERDDRKCCVRARYRHR